MSNSFFNKLNYSLANEDTTFEQKIVQSIKPKRVLSIAGSGARALPLVTDQTEELAVVDMAQEQLYLVELKRETIVQFEYQDFLQFWGYAPYDFEGGVKERKRLFYSLELEKSCLEFFEQLFEQFQWRSILYTGKWEKTFGTFSKVAQTIMSKEDFLPFLHFDSIEQQKDYYQKHFNLKRWFIILRLLGNASMFNALLYRGHFVKKNIDKKHFEFYRDVFERLFTTILVKDNFFIQVCLFGRIMTVDANTIEAQKTTFEQLKNDLPRCQLTSLQGDILSIAHASQQKYDFLSLSDVPSYFSGETEKSFLQQISPALNSGAVVVIRYYLRIAYDLDTSGFEDITDHYTQESAQECVQVYHIKVYRKE